MRPQCRCVVVVGGGVSGITTIKGLKEEGIEPVCFEKTNDIGGTWKYREQDFQDLTTVMWTTVLNTSKEFIFSDYPLPKEAANYLRHFEFHKHLINYCKKFDLLRHVVYNREVTYIQKHVDYEETGRWSVTSEDTITGEVKVEIFDGVFVCVGFLRCPNRAKFPGMEKFSGEIMHTCSLKKFGNFRGKRVVVIGTGSSAMDAAVEISSEAKQVYLSARTPSWILSRLGPYGLPIDYSMGRRYILYYEKILPLQVTNRVFEHVVCNLRFNHRLFGIEPKYPLLSQTPIFSDEIASKLLSGAVILRKNVQRFSEEGVIFDGENQVTNIDTIVLATGYTWNLDFLEEGTLIMENESFNLYRCMYPTHLKYPTFALIGFLLPFGALFPIAELQARLAAHLLANRKILPSEEVMMREAKNRHKASNTRFALCANVVRELRIEYIPFCDELATELGVMPNLWKMAFSDPPLFIACVFGPCVPYQYRLVGPHKWKRARETILTCSERMQTPLSADRLNNTDHLLSGIFSPSNLLIPIVIACLLTWINLPLCYYVSAFLIPYYLISSKFVSKYFIMLTLLPYFWNFYGFVAIYISTIIIFVYFNFGNLVINRHFWT